MALEVAEFRVQPVARRPAHLGRDDFDALAVLQRRVERHHVPVDLGPAAVVPEVGVQRIGEVDRRRSRGQVNHPALRRHHVHRVVQRRLLELLHPRRRIRHLVAPRQQLPQPRDLLVEGAFGARAGPGLLVTPVRGHAELGVLVHLLRADLHFQRAPVRADHGRVQAAVQVGLGTRDVVVELLRDRRPQVVHDAEGRIAVLQRIDDHAHRAHVEDLGEGQVLGAHLVVDREDVLGPALDLGMHAGRL